MEPKTKELIFEASKYLLVFKLFHFFLQYAPSKGIVKQNLDGSKV